MKEKFYSYLDGFNKVTVIYPKKNSSHLNKKRFFIIIESEKVEIEVVSTEDLGIELKFICSLKESIRFNTEYNIIDDEGNLSVLKSGAVVRTDLFEMLYSYSRDDLGIKYSSFETSFKVWSPVASEIELEVIRPGKEPEYHDLTPLPRGVWQVTVEGDLEGSKYRYNVRLGNDFKKVLDPYGISSDTNGKYNYVVDSKKFYKFKYKKPEFSGKPVDAVIYEMHIRDFTIDPSINNPKAGEYLGILEDVKTAEGFSTGIKYLKELGVTHVQLQPVFDFGSVDEGNKNKLYNWGYDPVQYFVPEGWYASDSNDPYSRINELRMLIDELHHAGIRVSLDVVYNHVYDYETFAYNRLVPGYFYRYDDRGIITHVSGCGNDVASERKMVHKFICDSVKYWMNEMNVDGFRFDLMGLLDVDTMNDVEMIVKTIDPNGIIYGEGWNMPTGLKDTQNANMSNARYLPELGFFNDVFRNTLKGNEFTHSIGYAGGKSVNLIDLSYILTGSSSDNFLFDSPCQSINYVECHDNMTFYDYLKKYGNYSEEELKDYCALALSIVLISQGVPFIHAGEEFLRTKQGEHNSYNLPDEINMLRWSMADQNRDIIEMVKALIKIRRTYPQFRLDRKSTIKEKIKLEDCTEFNTMKLTLSSLESKINVVIKNNYHPEHFDYSKMCKLIFDGRKAVSKNIYALDIDRPGVYIYVKGRD